MWESINLVHLGNANHILKEDDKWEDRMKLNLRLHLRFP